MEQIHAVDGLILKTFVQCKFLKAPHSRSQDTSPSNFYFLLGTPPSPYYTTPDWFIRTDYNTVLCTLSNLRGAAYNKVDGAQTNLEEYTSSRRAYVATQLAVRHCLAYLQFFI